MASREARQTAALVDLLQALPEAQLEAVLDGLGIHPARREAAGRKPDTRRCTVCGLGWYRCTTTWASDHEFSPHQGTPADPETVRRILEDPEAIVTKADAAEEFDSWVRSRDLEGQGL
jgi:hypothetical protein